MSQPTETKPALCPDCRRRLKLVRRVPEDVEFEGYKPGDVVESRGVLRSVDMGAVLLWVEQGDRFEDASGPGPDGGALGEVECEEHGELSVDALCAHYEAKL
jgi:hypothetical protein